MPDYFLYKNYWRFDGAPHHETPISNDAAQHILDHGGLLLRNTSDFDSKEHTSFWYVIKDHFEAFDELSSNTRRKVRRANDRLVYKSITAEQLKQQHGYDIYTSSMKSYKQHETPLSQHEFYNLLLTHTSECWGCYDKAKNTLVGFSINFLWNDACGYELMTMLPEYKHNSSYAYYGLVYAMNEHYLNNLKLHYVSDGSRSITEHSNIQDFLIQNFKFRKAYCKLKIHYKWWFGMTVKMLYPFRKIIPLPRAKAVLNMEAMQRGEK